MDKQLTRLLRPAYEPCPGFSSSCPDMRWSPSEGHIPRGFLGATADLNDVELVLVFAEPGDPQADEVHTGIESALHYVYYYHQGQRDQFHRNVRYVLNLCWPEIPFEAQLKRVWMTESVLCSAPRECGPVPRSTERACGERYLLRQLALFPNALVVALGTKAQTRLRALGHKDFLAVGALAPPGCNQTRVRESWNLIPQELARRRGRPVDFLSGAYTESGRVAQEWPPLLSTDRETRRKVCRDVLRGFYRVVDRSRLQATPMSDPGKWSIWQQIWECRSFEDLANACPDPAFTRTQRRITWQSEAMHAIKCGWIVPLSEPDDKNP